jgi:hypothetical protein
VFAAELIYLEIQFGSDMQARGITIGGCTPEVIVRLKRETRTTLSYAGLVKRAEFLGFAAAGALQRVRWKKLEESIFGLPTALGSTMVSRQVCLGNQGQAHVSPNSLSALVSSASSRRPLLGVGA